MGTLIVRTQKVATNASASPATTETVLRALTTTIAWKMTVCAHLDSALTSKEVLSAIVLKDMQLPMIEKHVKISTSALSSTFVSTEDVTIIQDLSDVIVYLVLKKMNKVQ